MHIGLNLGLPNTQYKPLADYLIRVAEQADQAGFATLVIPDHFSLRPESAPFLRRDEHTPTPVVTDFCEAWSVLAFLAARTKRIKLSTMVSGITMRYPAVLVKTADTLDALSNGRAYLGVGASPVAQVLRKIIHGNLTTASELVGRFDRFTKRARHVFTLSVQNRVQSGTHDGIHARPHTKTSTHQAHWWHKPASPRLRSCARWLVGYVSPP